MDKYIVKIWYRVDHLIKVMRTEINVNELIFGTLRGRVPGKILNIQFE